MGGRAGALVSGSTTRIRKCGRGLDHPFEVGDRRLDCFTRRDRRRPQLARMCDHTAFDPQPSLMPASSLLFSFSFPMPSIMFVRAVGFVGVWCSFFNPTWFRKLIFSLLIDCECVD